MNIPVSKRVKQNPTVLQTKKRNSGKTGLQYIIFFALFISNTHYMALFCLEG